MERKNGLEISVLLREESETMEDGKQVRAWIAQCLEHDIGAQGSSFVEAYARFKDVFVGQIIADLRNGNVPFENAGQAPKEYWDEFETAEFFVKDQFKIPMPVESREKEYAAVPEFADIKVLPLAA